MHTHSTCCMCSTRLLTMLFNHVWCPCMPTLHTPIDRIGCLLLLYAASQSTFDSGNYGNQYLLRAAIALQGLGALSSNIATYFNVQTDQNGAPLTGANGTVYTITFPSAPPANFFTSLTMWVHLFVSLLDMKHTAPVAPPAALAVACCLLRRLPTSPLVSVYLPALITSTQAPPTHPRQHSYPHHAPSLCLSFSFLLTDGCCTACTACAA